MPLRAASAMARATLFEPSCRMPHARLAVASSFCVRVASLSALVVFFFGAIFNHRALEAQFGVGSITI